MLDLGWWSDSREFDDRVPFTASEARTYRTQLDVFMTPDGAQPDIDWIDSAAYTW
jgi:hypothetical protein